MAFELKEGQGSLFTNGYKQKDSHPDYRGEVKIEGVVYEIAGWKKPTKAGGSYLSLAVKPKGEKSSYSTPKPEPKQTAHMATIDEIDDDLTF